MERGLDKKMQLVVGNKRNVKKLKKGFFLIFSLHSLSVSLRKIRLSCSQANYSMYPNANRSVS